jgi:hypothetical protein
LQRSVTDDGDDRPPGAGAFLRQGDTDGRRSSPTERAALLKKGSHQLGGSLYILG